MMAIQQELDATTGSNLRDKYAIVSAGETTYARSAELLESPGLWRHFFGQGNSRGKISVFAQRVTESEVSGHICRR